VVARQGDDRAAQAVQGLAVAIHDTVDVPQAQGTQYHREREDHLDEAGPIDEVEAAQGDDDRQHQERAGHGCQTHDDAAAQARGHGAQPGHGPAGGAGRPSVLRVTPMVSVMAGLRA
jgi:hypothetical protein